MSKKKDNEDILKAVMGKEIAEGETFSAILETTRQLAMDCRNLLFVADKRDAGLSAMYNKIVNILRKAEDDVIRIESEYDV